MLFSIGPFEKSYHLKKLNKIIQHRKFSVHNTLQQALGLFLSIEDNKLLTTTIGNGTVVRNEMDL